MRADISASNGHGNRSTQTRKRLIEAAIKVIGAAGYEGASTRALAKAAKVNLSAIPYHFGGKKELYLAAADVIADYARDRFEEVSSILVNQQSSDIAERLEKALLHLLHIILRDTEPRAWTSFVARCAYENDQAFALIHNKAIAPLLDSLIQIASEVGRREARDETLRLRISAIVTAIISFRFLRGIMLRDMGWKKLQDSGTRQIEQMIRDLCHSDFLQVRRSH